MMMNLVAIAVVLGLGGLWMTRGFFSALLHLVCTVLAGGIAFAAWEPLAYLLLDKVDPAGGMGLFLQGSAWGISLAVGFGLSLIILRVTTDSIVRANVTIPNAANYAGGALCGAASGVIAAGILVLSIGFLRTEKDFWGNQPLEYAGPGYVKRTGGLLLPVDKLTAGLYRRLSQTVLASDENLATLYPNLDVVPASLRLNYGDGKARNTLRAADFTLKGRYTVGEGKNLPVTDLLGDMFDARPQTANDLDDNPYPAGSHLEGFGILFQSGAREKSEPKVVVGTSQIRLVVVNADESESRTIFPVAAVMQAESANPVLRRFRYDAGEVYFASVGGAATAPFAFEFVVPPGFHSKALYVKNVRVMVDQDPALREPKARFATTAERDAGVLGGAIGRIAGASFAGGSEVDLAGAEKIKAGEWGQIDGFNISNNLPMTLHKTTIRTLQLDDNSNTVIDGEQEFAAAELSNPPIEQTLQVRRLRITSDVVVVQVDVSLNSKHSWLGGAAAMVENVLPPVLVDTNGTRYQPVGYIFKNSTSNSTRIRYTPTRVVQALAEIPTLSRSRPDDKLTLIFQVSLGASVQAFGVGEKMIVQYPKPIKLDTPQKDN